MIKPKVTTIGKSLGVLLPGELLAKLKVTEGDTVCLVETAAGYEIVSFDREFGRRRRVAERAMRNYRKALRAVDG